MQCASRIVVALCAMTLVSCGPVKEANLSGRPGNLLTLSDSGSFAPLTASIISEFLRDHRGSLNVQSVGTTSGIDSFRTGKLDLLEAPRLLEVSELESVGKENVDFFKLPVVADAIIVVVNARNQFAHSLTMDELRKIWRGDSRITRWSDIRADWPARPVHLYAPGPGCGTFEQFGKMVCGQGGMNPLCTRASSNAALVAMLSCDPDALSFMGNLQFNKSKSVMRPLALGNGGVSVLPSPVTIGDGSYLLNRKLYIYVNARAFQKKQGADFLRYYVGRIEQEAVAAGDLQLQGDEYKVARRGFENHFRSELSLARESR